MSRRKRIASVASTVLIVLMGLVGLGLILYPSVADWWNNLHQGYAIADYDHAVAELDPHEHDEVFAAAEAYNGRLAGRGLRLRLSEDEQEDYDAQLNVTPAGIMGVIDIPKIRITLPIYHGTEEEVLLEAIGHIAGTSLPVGGVGTHCCVSGHRGLPSARLFTDLGLLEVGDTFSITVLDREMTYEVDKISTVLPDEIDQLAIDPKKDLVTLVTCTPYGVNTHRLLVRGHRLDGDREAMRLVAEATLVSMPLVAAILAVPIAAVALLWLLLYTGGRIRHRRLKDRAASEFAERRAHRQGKE